MSIDTPTTTPVQPWPLTTTDVALVLTRYLTPQQVHTITNAFADPAGLRAVRSEFVASYRGAAWQGCRYDTTREGITVTLTHQHGAGGIPRAGVITWADIVDHINDRVTPSRLHDLTTAVTAVTRHHLSAPAPGRGQDARRTEHHQVTARLDQAATAAARAILTAPAPTQLDLLEELLQLQRAES